MREVMASTNPLVSVIIPFFNAPFLKEAIESILSQSFTDFELLLVDNASTDQSVQVGKSYASHPKVWLLEESRQGVVFAMNTGIQAARGQYIARMDADDISLPDRLKWQVDKLQSDSSLGVVSGLVEYVGEESNEGFIHYVDWLNSIQTNADIYLNQFVEFPMANPSKMFRKSVFDEYGMYREGDFPEDYEFFLRLQSHGVRMEKVTQPVLKWRDSSTRLTRTDPRYSQDAFFRIKAKYLTCWLQKKNPHHPNIFIWGAGRLSRRRSDYLLSEGINVLSYIDLKKSKKTIHFSELPDPGSCFVVSYVANRGAREEIRSFLNERGFKEGIDYILAS